jgi:hypothetical protein
VVVHFNKTRCWTSKIAFTQVARSEDYSTSLIKDYMHILKVMSNPPHTMKKREKLQSKGQKQRKSYNQYTFGTDTQLSKGTESDRERNTKRLGTGV